MTTILIGLILIVFSYPYSLYAQNLKWTPDIRTTGTHTLDNYTFPTDRKSMMSSKQYWYKLDRFGQAFFSPISSQQSESTDFFVGTKSFSNLYAVLRKKSIILNKSIYWGIFGNTTRVNDNIIHHDKTVPGFPGTALLAELPVTIEEKHRFRSRGFLLSLATPISDKWSAGVSFSRQTVKKENAFFNLLTEGSYKATLGNHALLKNLTLSMAKAGDQYTSKGILLSMQRIDKRLFDVSDTRDYSERDTTTQVSLVYYHSRLKGNSTGRLFAFGLNYSNNRGMYQTGIRAGSNLTFSWSWQISEKWSLSSLNNLEYMFDTSEYINGGGITTEHKGDLNSNYLLAFDWKKLTIFVNIDLNGTLGEKQREIRMITPHKSLTFHLKETQFLGLSFRPTENLTFYLTPPSPRLEGAFPLVLGASFDG